MTNRLLICTLLSLLVSGCLGVDEGAPPPSSPVGVQLIERHQDISAVVDETEGQLTLVLFTETPSQDLASVSWGVWCEDDADRPSDQNVIGDQMDHLTVESYVGRVVLHSSTIQCDGEDTHAWEAEWECGDVDAPNRSATYMSDVRASGGCWSDAGPFEVIVSIDSCWFTRWHGSE